MTITLEAGLAVLSSVAAFCAALAWLVWWLGEQFRAVSDRFNEKIDKVKTELLDKMDKHEDYDNERFQEIGIDLAGLRLAMDPSGALTPGYTSPFLEKFMLKKS